MDLTRKESNGRFQRIDGIHFSDNSCLFADNKGMNITRKRYRLSPARGFTLIELMVTVVISAVLAAVAIPSYTKMVMKGRRSEAFSALSTVVQAQERLRSNANQYTSDLSTLALPTLNQYVLSIEGVGTPPSYTAGYIVHAKPITNGLQAADDDCADLTITVQRGNVVNQSLNSTGASTTSTCWPK